MNIRNHIENGYRVVLDTNVLLNIYRYSPEFSEFALECLNAVREYIVLPATVKLEYDKHKNVEFSKMEERTKEASKETEHQISSAKEKILASCHGLERLQFQDIDDLKDSLSEKLDAVRDVLDNYFEAHAALDLIQHSWSGVDYLSNFVSEIDSNGQVMSSPSQEDIYRWCDDGQKRYDSKTPPGYKDAKNKDGVRKYSDLILWNETLRYAKNKLTNLVFVTDDVKADWWEYINNCRRFHTKLIKEFVKTGQQIIPMTSQDFFAEISEDYSIEKNDAVEIALRMTDNDYCRKIADSVFESVEEELMYSAIDYIDCDSADIGSEGIDEFEITDYKFVRAERIARNDNTVTYEFIYNITIEGTSYEYWGKDDDTKEIIRSNGKDHVFGGQIVVQVEREAEVFYDFEDDNSYETAIISGGKLKQTYSSERSDSPGELGYCPRCGEPLNVENDGGNGFCINCARDYD